MAREISVGELRQNPTQMLRDVRDGATYTVTDRGRPIAKVVPFTGPTWVPSEDVDALFRELAAQEPPGFREAWQEEIRENRKHFEMRDPFEDSE